MSPPKGLRASTSISMHRSSACECWFEIIDRPLTEPEDDTRPALTLSKARVEFSHVMFAYREGEPVLREISFVAEPGQVTALVGPSGGGKSTILNLIIRFYEAQGGIITIDGQDIATVARRSLRQQIALVGQDTFLFRASVRDNIAFGRPGATEAEIIAAAKAAHRSRLHHELPEWLRHGGGRAGPEALRRRAPACRHRARADQERADHPARRSNRPRSMPSPSAMCRRRSRSSAAAARRSQSRIGSPPSCKPTASW